MSVLLTPPPPDASATVRGLLNTVAQSFAGLKTFTNGVSIARPGGSYGQSILDVDQASQTNVAGLGLRNNGAGESGIFFDAPVSNGGTTFGVGNGLDQGGSGPSLRTVNRAMCFSVNSDAYAPAATASFHFTADGGNRPTYAIAAIRGGTSQSGPLLSLRNVGNTELAKVDAAGNSYAPTFCSPVGSVTAPASGAGMLYTGNGVALSFNGTIMLVAGGSAGVASQLGTTYAFYVPSAGAGYQSADSFRCTTEKPDGATSVGFITNTVNTFATSGAKLAEFRNNSVAKANVDKDGGLNQSGTDSSGTPGAATINKPTGISAIASGSSTVVITNSLATTTSRILITWLGDHGQARSWVSRAAGSFTVTLSGNASANTSFSWEISTII